MWKTQKNAAEIGLKSEITPHYILRKQARNRLPQKYALQQKHFFAFICAEHDYRLFDLWIGYFSATQEMLLNFPIYMMRMLLQAPHTCFDVDDGGDDNLMMM